MISTVATTKANPHINALESVFNEAKKPIEWLVIAHNDARMLKSVSSALADESAAMLEVSQDTWDFEGSELRETIEWALQQGSLTNVLLIGNSQAGGSESRASLVVSESTNEPGGSYAALLAGVRHNSARNRAAQERFSAAFQAMTQLPAIAERRGGGCLTVHGLFYRAESGIFLAYDVDTDSFQLLDAKV